MAKQHYLHSIIIAWLLFVPGNVIFTIDNPHFYRANFFWGEPRFEKSWLTSFDALVGGGSTKHARDQNGHKTALLNIFGLHNMRVLGQNVPGLDPNNNLDSILIDLEQIQPRENFGKLNVKGEFTVLEVVLNSYQNLINGFFFQGYLPIRQLRIDNIQFIDASPDDAIFPNKNTPVWLNFLNNFPEILARHDLAIKKVNRVGVGDFTILAGWASNYQDTCYLDFFDVSAKIGLLFPTGKKRNLIDPFDLALGYNGFYGFPVKFDCSIGYWEWLTLGFHIGSLFLFDREKTLALKTSEEQNGFITLTQGKAKVDPGTIWDVSCYLKADHFFKGLSLLCSYCFTLKEADCIDPRMNQIFNSRIVNHDQLFRSWRMHVIHWIIDYDFARKSTDIGPRIGVFYNWTIGGKRIFNTSVTGVFLGIDVAWGY